MANSPLFKMASRQMQQAARTAFAGSKLGVVLQTAQRASRYGLRYEGRLDSALRGYRRLQPRAMVRDALGSDFSEVVHAVEKYGRGGRVEKLAIDAFLAALGPAGGLIKALVGAIPKKDALQKELELAAQFLGTHGWEVTAPGKKKTGWTLGDVESAIAFLESRGKKVIDAKDAPKPKTSLPFFIPEKTKRGSMRRVVDIPVAEGLSQRFPVDHPLVTGAMVPAHSHNIHSYGYDVESEILYVRYMYTDSSGTKTKQAGSLYQYFDVDPRMFLAMHQAPSKGVWIWDKLRVRGTVSGHQKDYRLVGISHEYVPRKATINKWGEEVFVKRKVRTSKSRWLESEKEAGLIPDSFSRLNQRLHSGAPNTGRPAPPNRGRPNTGRP